jgi:hypothetical protein
LSEVVAKVVALCPDGIACVVGIGSLAALALAVIACLWAHRALKTAQDALALARSESQKADQLEVWKLRFQFLSLLTNERAKLMALQLELEALHAEHEGDHADVKAKVRACAKVFECLPRIGAAILELDGLHSRYMTLNPGSGVMPFRELADEQHRIGVEAELMVRSCADGIPLYKEKRHEAIRTRSWTTPPLLEDL